jgi:hypothetical protein
MAEITFTIGVAVGTQSALGSVNTTVRDLTSPIDSSDGAVLGDRESGDAESGIVIPDIERVFREVADVSGSWTKQASSFLRAAVTGMQIIHQLKGNGATSTPAAGEAKPLAGIDALLLGAGLSGANGTSPTYVYTPATSETYLTIKLWLAGFSMVFQDCLVETLELTMPPGNVGLASHSIRVGSVTTPPTAVAFPTFTYTTQASLSAPVIGSPATGFAWSNSRSFQEMLLTISNDIQEIPDSERSTGLRATQHGQSIVGGATIFIDDADSDYEYTELVKTVAPTDVFNFQVGTVAGGGATINAYKPQLGNPETRTLKWDRSGSKLIGRLSLQAVDPSAGGEFTLTFN